MKVIIKALAGSHLFGTNTLTSDTDYKGVFLPSAEQILLGDYKDTVNTTTGSNYSRNGKDDVDLELYSLRKFLKMISRGDTAALELLFTPKEMIIESSPEWEYIQTFRDQLISRKVVSMIGYARQQGAKYGLKGSRVGELGKFTKFMKSIEKNFDFQNAKLKHAWEDIITEVKNYDHIKLIELPIKSGDEIKDNPALSILGKKYDHHVLFSHLNKKLKEMYKAYGQRAREAEKNNGVDFKALSHAVRVCLQGQELLSTGFITLPLEKSNRDLVCGIKSGNIHYKEVAKIIEDNLEKLEANIKTSCIQSEVDVNLVKKITMKLHREVIENDI